MNLLIKFAYDGTKFSGYQRGNGSNSIEGAILSVLEETRIAGDIKSAARTDRNVSALGNVIMITTNERPDKVLGILNSKISEMVFHSYALVNETFNPRHCVQKKYSYFVSAPPENFEKELQKFAGRHDFRQFCRKDQRNSIRTIDRIDYTEESGGAKVVFYGKSFVWQQLRSIIGYALANPDPDTDPFSLKLKRRMVAPAEPLVLEDIVYEGVKFMPLVSASKQAAIREKMIYSVLCERFYAELFTRVYDLDER